MAGFNYCYLIFWGIFIGIYLGFSGMYGDWFIGENMNLNFFILMDVMGYGLMGGFNLVGGDLIGFGGLEGVIIEVEGVVLFC